MKYQRKDKMYEVNVWELKTFVLEVASFYRLKQLETSILLACCLDELRGLIAANPILHKMILKQLMYEVDINKEAFEIEKSLVMMKKLLQWNDVNYRKYREAFMKQLKGMMNPYFTSDLYILMRHLVENRNLFWLNDLYLMDDELQKYFLCEIYLIEEDYKMAYTYLKDCRYIGILQEYDEQLRDYSYSKYRKYILKEPLFKFNQLGDYVWMRSQLKY